MKNRIIASDIDGCLNNQRVALEKILLKHYNIVPDPLIFDCVENAGFVGKAKDVFWIRHEAEVDDVVISPNSVQVLKKLREEGFKVVLITARPYDIAQKTEDWLKEQGVEYDNILFNCGNKIDACKWAGAPMMVEDSDINVKALINGGVRVLMPIYSFNKYLSENPNVVPFSDWKDIYKEIIDFYS